MQNNPGPLETGGGGPQSKTQNKKIMNLSKEGTGGGVQKSNQKLLDLRNRPELRDAPHYARPTERRQEEGGGGGAVAYAPSVK